jgi:hypothetical protein
MRLHNIAKQQAAIPRQWVDRQKVVQISPHSGGWNLLSLLVDPSWSTYCIVKVLIPPKREFFRGLLDASRMTSLYEPTEDLPHPNNAAISRYVVRHQVTW